MTSLRRFSCVDLFRFNNINLDKLTETYNTPFYQQYLAVWPLYNMVAVMPSGRFGGYILGKVEGTDTSWHGHVTAVTVATEYRRIGIAKLLMAYCEQLSDQVMSGYFVDLYVRVSNTVAVNMYKRMGYSVYRQVIGYYAQEEDAYDMRKALSRDVDKRSVIPLPHPVHPDEND